MADVYSGCYVNIAASRAANPSEGCFTRIQNVHRGEALPGYNNVHVRCATPDPFDTSWMTSDSIKFDDNVWPLLSRAWVYQELLLAPRTVHFGSQEVLWQCKSDFQKQSMLPKLFRTDPYSKLPAKFLNETDSTLRERWYHIVEAYSWRRLTFQDDRLPAIAAMARQTMGLRVDDQYVVGLWVNTLLYDLAWIAYKRTDNAHANKPQSPSRIPTWSWAHAKGLIVWNQPRDDTTFRNVQVIETVCITDGPSVSGFIRRATITLLTPLIRLNTLRNQDELWDFQHTYSHSKVLNGSWKDNKKGGVYELLYGEISWDHNAHGLSSADKAVYALPLKRSLYQTAGFSSNLIALMVQAAHEDSHTSDTGTTDVLHATHGRTMYKRVGTATLQLAGGWAAQNIQTYCEDPDIIDVKGVYWEDLIEHIECMETQIVTLV
ncbi:hypothetical protein SVAN01_10265 [Stagonosporopsis vannaccii]|nr:hypothetical protein SVAN01_10265 [Stagonosporopsis vannaccii]